SIFPRCISSPVAQFEGLPCPKSEPQYIQTGLTGFFRMRIKKTVILIANPDQSCKSCLVLLNQSRLFDLERFANAWASTTWDVEVRMSEWPPPCLRFEPYYILHIPALPAG